MSRSAGAGRENRQAQAGQWKYPIPQTPCSVYKWGLVAGQESFFFFREFELFREVKLFQEFQRIHKIPKFHNRCPLGGGRGRGEQAAV